MGVPVKPLDKRIKRGLTTRQRRIETLRARLEVETDEQARRSIEAQLAFFSSRRASPNRSTP